VKETEDAKAREQRREKGGRFVISSSSNDFFVAIASFRIPESDPI
jgi:hypothetical protein